MEVGPKEDPSRRAIMSTIGVSILEMASEVGGMGRAS